MGLVGDIGKIGDNHLVTLLGLLLLIVPGMGVLLLFHPDLVLSADVFKILIIVLPIGVITILPTFLGISLAYASKLNGEIGIPMFALSAIICCVLSTALQTVSWFFSWPFAVYLVIHLVVFFIALPTTISAQKMMRQGR